MGLVQLTQRAAGVGGWAYWFSHTGFQSVQGIVTSKDDLSCGEVMSSHWISVCGEDDLLLVSDQTAVIIISHAVRREPNKHDM